MKKMDGLEKKSTHYIHRTSYGFQEKLVGVFILAALAMMLIMVFSQIKSQNIFEEYFVIYGKLKSAEGLSTESKILVSGFEVGHVDNIELTESNNILLTMKIKRRYHRLLREDSQIKVRGLGVIVGKPVIVLTAGSPDLKKIEEGATLQIQEPISIEHVTAEATSTIKTINTVIKKVAELLEVINTDDIRTTMDGIQGMALNLKEISKDMKSTEGPFGTLIYDTDTAENLKKSLESFKTASVNFKKITEDLDIAVAKLNSNLERVPLMLDNINELVYEAGDTVKATQRVWPISTSIKKEEVPKTMIDPVPASE